MNIVDVIQEGVIKGIKALYGADITAEQVTMNSTRKEFEGDYTVVAFPFARIARKKPDQIAEELGGFLVEEVEEVEKYNVINGFLNLSLSNGFWREFLAGICEDEAYGQQPANGKKVMVEFSSPNTNKPLHLGHIRNILLGWSTSQILKTAGYEVVKVQIVNDRGIAICKSMLAWRKYGEGASPESAGEKGDHFVGDYYVLFEKKFREEYNDWQQSEEARKVFGQQSENGQSEEAFFKAFKNTYFNEYSLLGAEAKDMLLKWEAGDKATASLWKQMNDWVYQGFDETYRSLGVEFDKLYFESDTYLLGKDAIRKGLEKGVFYQKDDGSVWIDLSDVNLDHKLVLRSDGTSVYMTQDIGTAQKRFQDFGVDKMVYVVADEQNYHFQVLFEILKRLGEPYAEGLYHLSYGMVDLPTGKMKSREGTVVDADDLIAEVVEEARKNTAERDTISGLSQEEQEEVIRKIALAALKFFIIKVQPRKRMVFDPKESVDLQGQTGPYVQNAYVRVQSVLRKAGDQPLSAASAYQQLEPQEKEILNMLYSFPGLVQLAAEEYDPSGIANFCYDLAKAYHRFYHDHSILNAGTEAAKAFRLQLSRAVAHVLKQGMNLLGIEMPDRM
ncbi:MAG: arginine--tRNA ligase [Lewinellaceae bacterium]|nr:arginine--tRNA ligase [Lewinellaceae bacterium]MCB9286845.1 arginine--tRNA ligase [Lewinellaceae bacterium]